MPKQRLIEQVRNKIRVKHYSIRTEEAYIAWIKKYILFLYKEVFKEKCRLALNGVSRT